MRLPRPCRLRIWGLSVCSSARQFGIGEPFPWHLIHRQSEAVSVVQEIVFRGTIVKPEYLLGDITVKMERLNSNVSPAKLPLQEAPKVIDALRMNLTTHISLMWFTAA